VILTCVSKNQIPSVVKVSELDTIATIQDLVGKLDTGLAGVGNDRPKIL
jgi:hypothetical protein